MKAYLLKKFGKPNVLKAHDVPDPVPLGHEVKVKVQSIGINYAEILSRRGQYSWAPKRPYIPGMEAFGEVVEVGKKVTHVKTGDHVIVGGQFGAYAEYVCTPEYLVFPAVEGFTADENAAFLVNYMTAWVALVKLGKMVPDDKVLIQAAAGGVGTAAVQLAKGTGCMVFGTASEASKLELLRELGADHPINYRTDDFYEFVKSRVNGVDLVLEVVGGKVFKKSIELLNPFGRLVVAGYASIPLKKWNPLTYWPAWRDAPKVDVRNMAIGSYGIAASHLGYLTDNPEIARNEWESLKGFCVDKQIRPVVGHTFSFDEIPEAHALIESRKSVGKVVIQVGDMDTGLKINSN